MDEVQLQQLLAGITQQNGQLAALRSTIGKQTREIEKQTQALTSGNNKKEEEKEGYLSFSRSVRKFEAVTGEFAKDFMQRAFLAPINLFLEAFNVRVFAPLQDTLAGLGSEFGELSPGLRGLDGGMMMAAQNSVKLLEMGFDPLNRQVLNLAGRMGTTNQNVGALFGSIENLIQQTDLSNNEIGDLALAVQESSERTGVSSERIVQGLNKLSGQLAFFNVGGLAKEIQDLTLSLQTGLPAALQELPAELIGGLVQGGPALRSILGFEGNLEEMIRAGSGGEAAFRDSVISLRDRLDEQIGLTQLSVTELQAIAPAFGGPQILNQIKQLADAFEEGDQVASIQEAFSNSISNLVNQIKEPFQAIAAGIFNTLAQFVAPIADLLKQLNPNLQELGQTIGNYLISIAKGILDVAIVLTDTLIPILVGAFTFAKAYQLGDIVAQRGLLVTLGQIGTLFTGGLSLITASFATAASTAAVTGALAAGTIAGVLVDNALDPVADGLRAVRDGIDKGNQRQEQKDVRDRLTTANINNLTGQSDYERFIQSFMSNNIASLMLTESGNAEVFRTLVDRLGLIAAASLRTATNTTPTVHPSPAAGAGTPPPRPTPMTNP